MVYMSLGMVYMSLETVYRASNSCFSGERGASSAQQRPQHLQEVAGPSATSGGTSGGHGVAPAESRELLLQVLWYLPLSNST